MACVDWLTDKALVTTITRPRFYFDSMIDERSTRVQLPNKHTLTYHGPLTYSLPACSQTDLFIYLGHSTATRS